MSSLFLCLTPSLISVLYYVGFIFAQAVHVVDLLPHTLPALTASRKQLHFPPYLSPSPRIASHWPALGHMTTTTKPSSQGDGQARVTVSSPTEGTREPRVGVEQGAGKNNSHIPCSRLTLSSGSTGWV